MCQGLNPHSATLSFWEMALTVLCLSLLLPAECED